MTVAAFPFGLVPVFEQTFLKPGRYFVGRNAAGEKQYLDLTPEQIRDYAEGTRGLIAAGYRPPVLLEHAAPNTVDGAPVLTRDAKAAAVKHGVGWLRDVKVGEDGTAIHTFDVRDKAVAEQIKSGAIQFTSPELRPAWTDGKGRDHRNIIAHVALTHRPRNPDQSQPVEVAEAAPALQFSLADFEGPIQLADDDDPGPDKEKSDDPPAADPPAENPDAPADSNQESKFQAVLEQIKAQFGLDLVSDTTPENFYDHFLTALKTMAAVKAKADGEAAADSEDEEGPNPDSPGDDITEDRGPMQFSLGDFEADTFADKLLARVVKQDHERRVGRLNSMVGDQITSRLRGRLLDGQNAMQFSADGEAQPHFTLDQVIDILADSMPHGSAWGQDDPTQFSAEEHPSGADYFLPPKDQQELTEAQADEIAKRVVSR